MIFTSNTKNLCLGYAFGCKYVWACFFLFLCDCCCIFVYILSINFNDIILYYYSILFHTFFAIVFAFIVYRHFHDVCLIDSSRLCPFVYLFTFCFHFQTFLFASNAFSIFVSILIYFFQWFQTTKNGTSSFFLPILFIYFFVFIVVVVGFFSNVCNQTITTKNARDKWNEQHISNQSYRGRTEAKIFWQILI